MTAAIRGEAAEIGRLFYTHRLDPNLAASALQISPDDAVGLVGGDNEVLGAIDAQDGRASLLLNVLVRLEQRCGHDSAALRAALERPLDELGGDCIAERLHGQLDVASLRLLREVAGTLPVPKVKFWRCADRYS